VLRALDRRGIDAKPTDLQRGYRRLLDLAEEGSIVNIRQTGGKPVITLVSNREWNEAMLARAWLSMLSAVVKYATGRILRQESPVCPSEFAWLQLYKSEDDVRAFVDELSGAINRAANGAQSWDEVDAVVHEWSRSAALLEHPEVMDRFCRTEEQREH
jgi:hypothetical protein